MYPGACLYITKNPARLSGVFFAKENNYLCETNTPGPIVELSEMLLT